MMNPMLEISVKNEIVYETGLLSCTKQILDMILTKYKKYFNIDPPSNRIVLDVSSSEDKEDTYVFTASLYNNHSGKLMNEEVIEVPYSYINKERILCTRATVLLLDVFLRLLEYIMDESGYRTRYSEVFESIFAMFSSSKDFDETYAMIDGMAISWRTGILQLSKDLFTPKMLLEFEKHLENGGSYYDTKSNDIVNTIFNKLVSGKKSLKSTITNYSPITIMEDNISITFNVNGTQYTIKDEIKNYSDFHWITKYLTKIIIYIYSINLISEGKEIDKNTIEVCTAYCTNCMELNFDEEEGAVVKC